MYLKKLEMQGFKSFPDKITLDFTTGMTAIVGPNGSGKSNITDAVRWVLGEQSAKMLRGSKMEDVIFNGTDSRKPLGFAEVSVVFDNSDKKLNIEFDEVTVTRRVFRSGEGEYFINKTACRLKDVHELFMDTGLGRDGYSIIGQGKIDEILSNKSEDRRQIFEEAAGISKYKYRRLEAQRKLSGTEDNLSRITDILTELEERVGPLEVQSEKALKYLDLRERLKFLDATVSVMNIDRIKSVIGDIDAEFRGIKESERQCNDLLDSLDREINSLYSSIGTTEQEIADIREAISSFEGDIRLNINEIDIFNNTIEQNRQESLRLEDEIKNASSRILDAEKECKDKREETHRLEIAIAEKKNQLFLKNEELSKAEKEVAEVSEELRASNEYVASLTAEISELRADLSGVDALCESYKAQMIDIDSKIAETDAKVEEYRKNAAELEALGRKTEKQIDEISEKEKSQQKILDDLKKKLEFDDKLLFDKISLCNSKKDRVQMLTDLEADYEGYQKGVKSVMQAKSGELKKCGINAPLSRLIDVPGEYILAIENALGNALQNIVTENEEDAKRAIEYLKRTKAGRVTFLPVTAVKPRKFEFDVAGCTGFIGMADKLVESDARYKDILSGLLGAVVVTDNIDNAVLMAKKFSYKFKIATLDGEIINSGGSITGGNTGKGSGILSRAGQKKALMAEVEELEKSINAFREKNKKSQEKILEAENTIASLENSKNQLQDEYRQIAAEHNNINYSLAECKKQLAEFDESKEVINSRLSDIDVQTRERREKLEELKEKSAKAGGVSSELREKFERASLVLDSKRHEVFDFGSEISEDEKLAAVEAEKLNSLRMVIESENNGITASKSRIEAFTVKNSGLQAEIELKQQKIKDIHTEIDSRKKRLADIEEGKSERSGEIEALQAKIKEERERYAVIQQQLSRVETKKNKNELEYDAIVNRLWEDYGLTYVTALEYKVEVESLNKAQREINSVKSQISSLGNINIDAIEEYKQVKQRYEFMSSQKNDLTDAKESLEKIISEMQELMKTIFSEQFRIINENFAVTFRQLFGGGKAELKLSDPSDILESGIDIDVQPPGKKLQNLMLLSGGEKALCAIAILFAILKTRPAPFCIFDEIEAALDDINVYKFAEYVRVMNKNTQFLVVTHRRGTMESADKLYGVTMPKKGISTMIDLDISQLDKKIKGE